MPARPPSPKSNYASDPALAPFLGATFDPTAYLNAHIPPLAFATPAQPVLPPRHQALPEVAAATQAHVAQLSAQLNRLSDTLTGLTDDILRAAPRLAYSVELLRGDANALVDGLRQGLATDVAAFVPGGVDAGVARLRAKPDPDADPEAEQDAAPPGPEDSEAPAAAAGADAAPRPAEPAALARLRTLHAARARLQEVTEVFDRALAWPLPPSARAAASFVGVSAPADADPAAAKALEEQGLEAQRVLREGVAELLAPGGRSAGAEGVLAAEAQVRGLRELCEVWRGTAEEKARSKFVDGLAKTVADRRREEEAKGALKKVEDEDGRADDRRGGLFSGFRRLRDEIIME